GRRDARPETAESRKPRAESRKPRAESRKPRVESRKPRAESRKPRAESRKPRAESRKPRAEYTMTTLPELLQTLVENEGSDLHIATDTPPQIRVHGHLRRLALPDLQPSDTKQLVYSVLTDAQKKRFEETLE